MTIERCVVLAPDNRQNPPNVSNFFVPDLCPFEPSIKNVYPSPFYAKPNPPSGCCKTVVPAHSVFIGYAVLGVFQNLSFSAYLNVPSFNIISLLETIHLSAYIYMLKPLDMYTTN